MILTIYPNPIEHRFHWQLHGIGATLLAQCLALFGSFPIIIHDIPTQPYHIFGVSRLQGPKGVTGVHSSAEIVVRTPRSRVRNSRSFNAAADHRRASSPRP